MTRVLYWGHEAWRPIPYYRGQMFWPYMPDLGYEIGAVGFYEIATLASVEGGVEEATRALAWADLVVFRRWYPDTLTPIAWDWCAANGKARLYDTDDWDLATPTKIPRHELIMAKRDLVARMARDADLLTVSTPVLASRYGAASGRKPLILRNAIDMSLYVPTRERPERDHPLAVFYGSQARLRDYFGADDPLTGKWQSGYASEAVKYLGLGSLWIGHDTGPYPVEFDLCIDWDHDLRVFATTLASSHGDVGLAPLLGSDFDYAKSELHWLDFSAAGIPTVAERLMGENPYRPIRDGVDGLLARGRAGWHDAVKRVVTEPALAADLVAAARERMRTDYDPRRRAAEWAEAFRLALA